MINPEQLLTAVALPSAAAQPRRSRNWPSSQEACGGSPLTPSLLPSPVPLGPAPTDTNTQEAVVIRVTRTTHLFILCMSTYWVFYSLLFLSLAEKIVLCWTVNTKTKVILSKSGLVCVCIWWIKLLHVATCQQNGVDHTCISQSNLSSSLRICSLSCFMSLDLSIMLEFTLKATQARYRWCRLKSNFFFKVLGKDFIDIEKRSLVIFWLTSGERCLVYLLPRLLQAEFHVGESTVLLLHVTDQFSQKHLQHS